MTLYEPFKTVPLSKFHPELKFEFGDLPEQLFDYALIRAARTLAKEGNVIRRRVIVQLYPNAETYKLRSPDGLEFCSILSVYFASSACCCDVELRRSFDPPRGSLLCARSFAWYDDIEEELHVTGCHKNDTLYVTMSVCPPDDTCEFPSILFDDYVDLLLLGAKARILRIDNKPWTNLQLATMYEKGFNDGIAAAAVDTFTKHQRGSIKVNWGKIL